MTPLYFPAALWLRHIGGPRDAEQMRFYAEAMEKLAAALMAALSAGILFLALRKVTTARASLVIALVYALASPTWNISSQALWLHGMTELSFALLLWALVRDDGSRRAALWIGTALALAMANKLTNAVVAAPIIFYFCWRGRSRGSKGRTL